MRRNLKTAFWIVASVTMAVCFFVRLDRGEWAVGIIDLAMVGFFSFLAKESLDEVNP